MLDKVTLSGVLFKIKPTLCKQACVNLQTKLSEKLLATSTDAARNKER